MRRLQSEKIPMLDEAVLLGVLSDVKGGDFSVRMPLDWTGVPGKVADVLNDVIAANEMLSAELERVSRVVGKEGKLTQCVTYRGSDQVCSQTIESVNDLIDDLVRPDSSHFAMEMDLSQMRIGERTSTIGCVRDISGHKAYTEALVQRTLHDDLTGLPNRMLFSDRVDQALVAAGRTDEPIGVLVIGFDRFAEVNATFGRETGDALLHGRQRLGLQSCARQLPSRYRG
jgi:hypothetical protein